MTGPDAITGLASLASAMLSPTVPDNLDEETAQAVRRAWPHAVEQIVAKQLADRTGPEQPLGQALAAAAEQALDAYLSGQGSAPALEFPSSAAWLEQYLLPHYVRRSGTHRWCPQWWAHPEAVARIEALWRAWEGLRWDGSTGMAVWWSDYCDPHMNVLLSLEGPFHACARGHTMPEPFTTVPIPEDPAPAAQDAGR